MKTVPTDTGAGRAVLAGISLVLRRGDLTAVIARRGAGRSTLAAILAGQRLPDRGTVSIAGRNAPLVGHFAGFGLSGSVERDLALRAAAAGIDSAAYLRAVVAMLAPVLGGGGWVTGPFEALPPPARIGLLHAAGWAMPADLYIADGPLLPAEPRLARCLRPVLAAARRRASVLWLTAGTRGFRRLGPDRILRLEDGALIPVPDVDTACRWLDGTGTSDTAKPLGHDDDDTVLQLSNPLPARRRDPPRSQPDAPRAPHAELLVDDPLVTGPPQRVGAGIASGAQSPGDGGGAPGAGAGAPPHRCLFALMRAGSPRAPAPPDAAGSLAALDATPSLTTESHAPAPRLGARGQWQRGP